MQNVVSESKVIIYTCVTHGYDTLKPIDGTPEQKFVCFTDCPKKTPPGWQVRPLQSPERLTSGHDINRYHKLFPHRLFPEYRYSVYIDGNVRFLPSYLDLVHAIAGSNLALGAFTHPDNRTLLEESNACVRFNKISAGDIPSLKRQLRSYEEDGFDVSAAVTANYLLARDHDHPSLPLAMSLWWSQLFEFTKRDQLSLNYVLWKTALPWGYLDRDLGIDATRLYRTPHNIKMRDRLGYPSKALKHIIRRAKGRNKA